MTRFLHLQSLASESATQFCGRVGSIISELRPALPLVEDSIPPETATPQDFAAEFDALKDRIRIAARSVGRIETDGANPTVLATCFRVGSDPRRVATARHVAAALLQNTARLPPGDDPKISPARLKKLRPLIVVFEKNDTDAEERHSIEAIELSHGVMDLLILRLEADSARPSLELSAPLRGDATSDAKVCVIGYPVSRPSASDDTHFEALFAVGGAVRTGIKRASPGRLRTVDFPPDPAHFDVLHDATTLPGSSGSPVISVEDGTLVGLHYRGKAGGDRNMMIYLPAAWTDPALHERFDPAFAGSAPTGFAGWAADSDNTVIGRPLTLNLTAEEMEEIATPSQNDRSSAAPENYGYSPAIMYDRRDIRDRMYAPPLQDPKPRLYPAKIIGGSPRKQGFLADCTGCALASTVEYALAKQGRDAAISARMLYEMARLHDEFVDDLPAGTSLRGSIKGFFHNGVCPASAMDDAPDWFLSVARAKQARDVSLGAYYRLRPSLPDFQMAIQVAGAVVVSAWTHPGWTHPVKGQITRRRDRRAAHAVVLIGYDETGFLVQNSWGAGWGGWTHPDTGETLKGVAHWSYADWADSVMDAWVLQIAPPAPVAHNLPLRAYLFAQEPQLGIHPPEIAALPEPRRMAIIGHVAHVERSGLVDAGRIGVGQQAIRETSIYLSSPRCWTNKDRKYTDLAFVFHDPMLGVESAARLSAHLVPRFKAARIYPMNILYGADEIRSLSARMIDEARFAGELTARAPEDLTAYLDRRARAVAASLLKALVGGIDAAADLGGPLWSVLASFGVESVAPPTGKGRGRGVHVVGIGLGALAASACFGSQVAPAAYGTGAILARNPVSVSLLAPIARPGPDLDDPASWSPVAGGAPPRMFIERLGPTRPQGTAMDGYRGDWVDLVASMFGPGAESPRNTDKRSRNPATLSALATDSQILNGILKTMTGTSRLGEWVNF